MGKVRKPFQGVINIIWFNWHFYVLVIFFLPLILFVAETVKYPFNIILYVLCAIAIFIMSISLMTSFYVYDLSGLYDFKWMNTFDVNRNLKIVNINAGFDETSALLKNKFLKSEITVFDFYDPQLHTEVSIKRARKAYPQYPNTKSVKTNQLPLPDNSIDLVFVILAAHEIRNKDERKMFFKELNRIIKIDGQIIVTEHLRDVANFLAYNIGFFHFHSKRIWFKAFSSADLTVLSEIKTTPFISNFTLTKNGITH